MSGYDSKADTLEHVQHVRNGIGFAISELVYRAQIHDDTKLGPEEKETFDEVTPRLRALTYGSEEYKASLREMGAALEHHYASHRHHPEFFGEQGMLGMNLVDLLEMVIDWYAATKRHDDGDLYRSIELNQARFGYSDELRRIFRNTAHWLIDQRDGCRAQSRPEPYQHGKSICVQDYCENAAFNNVGGVENRSNMKAPDYIPPENQEAYLAGYRAGALELFGEDWETCEFGWGPALTIGADEPTPEAPTAETGGEL